MLLGLVMAVPTIGAVVLFASLVRRGFGWARFASFGTSALGVPAAIANGSPIAVVLIVASLVAVLLLWLPTPDRYFRLTKANRVRSSRERVAGT